MATNPHAFDLKADSFSFPTLYLLSTDLDAVEALLEQRLEQAPDFFRNAPLVIDLSRLDTNHQMVEFPLLVGMLRGRGIIPIGLRGGTPEEQHSATLTELAILGEGARPKRTRSAPTAAEGAPPEATAAGEAESTPASSTVVVTRPVRSGQRVYAAGGDLVVLAPVSSGAELMADGHIHTYSALRGRVLAGVKGDRSARVFCSSLQAELVSIAGRYMLIDDYPPKMVGQSVHFYLERDHLYIQPLPA